MKGSRVQVPFEAYWLKAMKHCRIVGSAVFFICILFTGLSYFYCFFLTDNTTSYLFMKYIHYTKHVFLILNVYSNENKAI